MKAKKNNLFLTLLKLKSYLVSMIDDPVEHYENLDMSEQYLELRFPDQKNEIVGLLKTNNILSDSEIAFDEKILFKFRTIANTSHNNAGLKDILSEFDITGSDITPGNAATENNSLQREKHLSELLYILYNLATEWEVLKNLGDKADTLLILNSEEVIRPEEQKNLQALAETTKKTFKAISLLSNKYVNTLAAYFYKNGGREILEHYIINLDAMRKFVSKRYFSFPQRIKLNIIRMLLK